MFRATGNAHSVMFGISARGLEGLEICMERMPCSRQCSLHALIHARFSAKRSVQFVPLNPDDLQIDNIKLVQMLTILEDTAKKLPISQWHTAFESGRTFLKKLLPRPCPMKIRIKRNRCSGTPHVSSLGRCSSNPV